MTYRLRHAQASNTMWLRRGMESVVFSKSYSIGSTWRSFDSEIKMHKRFALFRALTGGEQPPFAYHEGSFYPVEAIRAFQDFVLTWNRENNQSLKASMLKVPNYPEEQWLQGFVVSHFEPFRRVVRNGQSPFTPAVLA